MSDDQAVLEVYDLSGALILSVEMRRDERDDTKWHLIGSVDLSRRDRRAL